MMPLLVKKGQLTYIPCGSMDMEGLINRLPDIHERAARWITAFEDETLAVVLAVGDIKALLGKIVGKQEMEELLVVTWQNNSRSNTVSHM